MSANHPYKDSDSSHQSHPKNSYDNLDDAIRDAVSFGTDIGSSVLSSIAAALGSVGDSLQNAAQNAAQREALPFARFRRRLDAELSGKYGGWMTMGVFGWILFGSFGIAAVTMAILLAVGLMSAGAFPQSAVVTFKVLAPVFSLLTLAFGYMGYAGCHRANYVGRLRKYLRAAQDFTTPISEIARTCMKNSKKVRQDLQNAILDGKLPNACLDREQETLYLDNTLYQPVGTNPAPPTAQPDAAPTEETPAQQLKREGVAFLAYLRGCVGKLGCDADEELNQMLKTCGAILGFAHNHPEQVARLRHFRDYYLPTTRKLLDTAMGLGEADADNARTIRRDITAILHTLNQAYLKLYDTLLQDVSMDVSTEIDTLETMLRQDGLTHDFASDFYPKPGQTLQKRG